MDKKAKSAYEQYEIAKEHFDAVQAEEDDFRHGFITGYCMAKDESKPKRKQHKTPAE